LEGASKREFRGMCLRSLCTPSLCGFIMVAFVGGVMKRWTERL
jgi:hypothetical protein